MEALTRAALRFPGAVLALLLGLIVVALVGIPRTQTEIGYRALLGEQNPAIVELKILRQTQDSVITDELTRLHNYRHFQEQIRIEARRAERL